MFKDGAFVTPPVTDDILEGITRTLIIGLIKDELGLRSSSAASTAPSSTPATSCSVRHRRRRSHR